MAGHPRRARMIRRRLGWTLLAGLTACLPLTGFARTPVVVGSKSFTESVILGEIVTRLINDKGGAARHRRELGGTRVLWDALLAGQIDVYPEYTGTLRQEILAGEGVGHGLTLAQALARHHVRMSAPLGFSNTYALGMKATLAGKLGIRTVSDLKGHPGLVFGLSNEFMDRADGWPGLRAAYGLAPRRVQGLQHDLAYRGIASGALDVTDLYTTDPEIAYYHLRVLDDDRHYFPRYQAVLVYRAGLAQARPAVAAALASLPGRIGQSRMIHMNARVKLDHVSEDAVAAGFIKRQFGLDSTGRVEDIGARLWRRTVEHLTLVLISLSMAVALAIPLGVVAALRPRWGQVILGVTGVIQTLPALAVLVFMIPLLGIGARPAVAALFLYSLLPIVRNTYTGLRDIPVSLRESARALGLPLGARLRLIDVPLASRAILAGIKTSAVINIGTATLGALIGAGGYGQPILTGIRLDDMGLILQGAVPAALMALAAQGGFDLLEKAVVPKGVRIHTRQ